MVGRVFVGIMAVALGLGVARPALAQEAFRSVGFFPEDTETTWTLSWSQIASGFERQGPFQFYPVLGVAYAWRPDWAAAVHYDFQSLAFEARHRLSDPASAWDYGAKFGLVPELRSFSWKVGIWGGRRLLGARLLGTLELLSLNAWGQGLWASDLEVTPSGRAWVVPLRLDYVRTIAESLELKIGLEGRFGLGEARIKNRYSILLGLEKGFR